MRKDWDERAERKGLSCITPHSRTEEEFEKGGAIQTGVILEGIPEENRSIVLDIVLNRHETGIDYRAQLRHQSVSLATKKIGTRSIRLS